ncbi:acyl-CoA N-acyltransferase [Abortiporus biennis]|nr:acyl-CoA N-acyltransferase [Abortiporus biennis]
MTDSLESKKPDYEIIRIHKDVTKQWEELRQQCFDLRIEVFHHEQGFPLETEVDGLEDIATHFLLRLRPSSKPIGTVRCTKEDGYCRLRSLVILKDYRKYKFGRDLVEAVHEFAKEEARKSGLSVIEIHSHSQIPVRGFYAKFGYEPKGEEFAEDGAAHQLMTLQLPL